MDNEIENKEYILDKLMYNVLQKTNYKYLMYYFVTCNNKCILPKYVYSNDMIILEKILIDTFPLNYEIINNKIENEEEYRETYKLKDKDNKYCETRKYKEYNGYNGVDKMYVKIYSHNKMHIPEQDQNK